MEVPKPTMIREMNQRTYGHTVCRGMGAVFRLLLEFTKATIIHLLAKFEQIVGFLWREFLVRWHLQRW